MKPSNRQRTRKGDVTASSTKPSSAVYKAKSPATDVVRSLERKTRFLLLVWISRNRSRGRRRPTLRCPSQWCRIYTAPSKVTHRLKFCQQRSTHVVDVVCRSLRRSDLGSASCRQSFASK